MNRRDIITAAPAAGLTALVAGALPVGAACAIPVETPVAALFREWVVIKAEEDRVYTEEPTGNGDTEECQIATDAVKAMEAKLIATPGHGAGDFAMKVYALTGGGQWALPSIYSTPDLWSEARALVGA